MWKIILFLEKWLVYPIMFTICYVVYSVLYMIMTFELPDVSYSEIKGGNLHSDSHLSNFAHFISFFAFAVALSVLIFYTFFGSDIHRIYSHYPAH